MDITVTRCRLEGVLLVSTDFFRDERGFFIENYHRQRFADHGITDDFVQDNHSRSSRGVLRGFHYQDMTAPMGKLVRCTIGRILDVAVDLRVGSPTLGQWVAEELSEENMRQLLLRYFAVDPAIITDDLVRTRYEASVAPGAFEAYRDMFSSPRHAGSELGITEEQVKSVPSRTLLVHGREDKVVPVQVAWNMVRLLPDADLAVFARCGHWTQIERADDFNDLVRNFLAPAGRARN